MDVRIGFYMRSGLYVTPDLGLTNEKGFRKFVYGIVGLNSWTDPTKAGFDTTRTDEEITLPGGEVYTIEHTYVERPGITGKATRVYRLVKKEEPEAGEHEFNWSCQYYARRACRQTKRKLLLPLLLNKDQQQYNDKKRKVNRAGDLS